MNTILKATLLAAALTAWGSAGAATASDKNAPPPQEGSFSHAVDLLKSGRHAAAYGRLMKLADAGHVPSAQLALVMLAHGKAFYGSEWSASPNQQVAWNSLIVNQMRHHIPIVGIASGE